MNSSSTDVKRQIFRNELLQLKDKEYISTENFEKTMHAYNQFYADIEVKIAQQRLEAAKETPIKISVPQVKKVEKLKPSPEQIRERNISWLLNLGVILLLIGGLFVATSNWDTMSNLMKTSLIAFVSVLFYGIAYISKKILKIERTSFAFIILGSLFLPIFVLSIGWFELVGPYFSFYGEGRFILGAVGSLVLFPVYALFAKRLYSRLFVWFSFIALTFFAAYFLAAIQLGKDRFYLGMMVYNILLVVGYHRMKYRENLKLFTKELVYFAQISLILSTLMMLVFFNSHVLYSLNILLSAAVYLSMVYVTGRKEFHFVFSVMAVYGAYQLIEHSVLETFGPVFYVLVGVGFLAVPKLMDGKYQWEKVFRLTSAIVSCLAFLYISVEGILLRMNEPSLALLLAYIVIATQFTYLANVMKKSLFSYLSPIFFTSAMYELVLMLDKVFDFNHLTLPIFMIGFVLFVTFGYVLKPPFFKVIVKSSRDVSLVVMLFSILLGFATFNWFHTGIMFLLLSLVFILADRVEKRSMYTNGIPWGIPLSFGFAFFVLGEEMRNSFHFYEVNFGMSMNAVLASVSLLLLSYIWKIKQNHLFKKNAFFIAQSFYTLAIFAAIFLPINGVWMRPVVLLVGVGMYAALYFVTKFNWVPFIVASLSLKTYFSVLYALHLKRFNPELLIQNQITFGAVLLIVVSYLLLKKEPLIAKGFAWIGHIYLPFALLLTFAIFWQKSIWSFIIALAVYWISSRITQKEWKAKVFLYSSFLALFMVFSTGLYRFYSGNYIDYAFLLTSVVIFLFWFTAKNEDKQRTVFFFIPFSLVGVFSFAATYPFGWLPFMMMVLYTTGLILFLHKIKKDIFVALPLFLLFIGTECFLFISGIDLSVRILLASGLGIGLASCGQLLYQKLYSREEKRVKFDSYTIVAFLFFTAMFALQTEALWTQILPGLLLSVLFYTQRQRVVSNFSWLPMIAAGVLLLQPYYTVLETVNIPEVIETEMNVLPFVAVIIFVRRCLKDKYTEITSAWQWGILMIVSTVLIADGLSSSTIYDAIILGSLSIVSLLAGMFLRVKSYFFVGSGVLLLNVLLQTRPYWGNLPWWAYLLITGTILIAVASYNEWLKQKMAKGDETLMAKWKKYVMNKMTEWK